MVLWLVEPREHSPLPLPTPEWGDIPAKVRGILPPGGVTHPTKFWTIRLTRFSDAFLRDRAIFPRLRDA